MHYLCISQTVVVAVFVAFLGVSYALPVQEETHINTDVLQHTEIRDEAGQYSLSYLTSNGIAVAEQGALKPNKAGTDNVLVKQVNVLYNIYSYPDKCS